MEAAPGQMEIVYRGNPKFLLVRPPTQWGTQLQPAPGQGDVLALRLNA